ncbi:MAG: pyridoxal-dependent decarboxylase [Acidaminococcus sp.]|jgi:glutamate/tyrosine decarboxylase-like PLP-dependent enzyme|nr:pyridoxal-dependent decarboxylase [Acidaminococcus sp.]MCI2100448.1 pyridoxal-dependent decarboxylase [Acidaminococcus sp.]MCI2114769.1 pyridoxal-dependent decarboxylase [Acidaminococcus sp.]MCI2116811.1 pyridoxal-dependent decarboxylase [Acidaminococcus sp.]
MDQKTERLLNRTAELCRDYVKNADARPPFPTEDSLALLKKFEETLPENGTDAERVIEELNAYGAPNTANLLGRRFFGFVNGGLLPVALAAQWVVDTWNQNGATYVMSPVVSKLEDQCEKWMTALLGLPKGTAMGLVTGSSNAIICALAAARCELLRRQDYDVYQKGLRQAPPIRIIMGAGAHSAVKAALSVLGIGQDEVEVVPCDDTGAIIPNEVPALDSHTLLILQAANVTGGHFDNFRTLCAKARKANAWVHIDGAFGLWAAASPRQKHLTEGIELADSWSLDAHKTLNAGYDCGIVLCRSREALVRALQANGSYFTYSKQRDGMQYTTEMSRRARAVVLWAVLKQLGHEGVAALVDRLCDNAAYFAHSLEKAGFILGAPPCFNQGVIRCSTPRETKAVLAGIQKSGVCWCSGADWNGVPAIRLSVCSYRTTKEDIDAAVAEFVRVRDAICK